jgi:hypothetical protein
MQLSLLEPVLTYTDTKYATRCMYLYNVVPYVKIWHAVHWDGSPCSSIKTFTLVKIRCYERKYWSNMKAVENILILA